MDAMSSHPDHTRAVAALRFRALGDETRLRILEYLASGERSVSDVMARLDLGQSLISHHLRILRESGLVIDRREGRWIHYSIAEPALAACRLALYEMEPLRSEAATSARRTLAGRHSAPIRTRCGRGVCPAGQIRPRVRSASHRSRYASIDID